MPHRAIVLAEETWIAARTLSAWLDAGQEVAEVWVCAGSSLAKPLRQPLAFAFPDWSVRRIIRRRGLPVHRCPRLRAWPEAVARAAAVRADSLLNILGLQIIPTDLLAHFADRAVNVHPALLPRYRGPCPRLAMLVDGRDDEAGGVCVHLLTDGIDEGAIVGERHVPFPIDGGYAEWDARLADAAAALVREAVIPWLDGGLVPRPQDESLAFYRRPVAGDLDVGPATPLDHARRLGDTLGRVGRLVCKPSRGQTRRPSYHVTGVQRVLGPPTGRPARVTWQSVELDLADARVRMRRRGLGDRVRTQAEAVAALRRRQRGAPA
ncbi:MAG: formyltransferase family protein [Pirellulales bacterium]